MRTRMKKIIVLVLTVLLVGAGAFWLYTSKKEKTKYSGPTEKVSLRLKWLHQAQFAGNYVAAKMGYYTNQGLVVDLQPINLDENTIQAVADGKIDFGISGADDVILARAKGIPVKAIAVIYKINPAAVISLEGKGINEPKDLIGKKVGLQKGNPIEYLFNVMLESKGIKLSEVKKVAIGYDASELLTGKVDAIVGYITNEPDMVIQAGQKPKSILMADYGVNMYADVLFASDKLIETKPAMVERFVKATLDGWQYAIEHEVEAVDITLEYAKDSKKSHEAYMLRSSLPLIHSGESRLGMMTPAQWEQMQEILFKQKLLAKKIAVTDAYTMQFLNAIYK
jgi:NitT/TauT family transport system substrate-binding protein